MFDIKKTLDKVIRGAVASGIAVVASFLAKSIPGFELTIEQQGALIALVFGLIAGLTNILKHKFPKIFGWL